MPGTTSPACATTTPLRSTQSSPSSSWPRTYQKLPGSTPDHQKRSIGEVPADASEAIYGFFVNIGGVIFTSLFNLLYGTNLTDGATMFKVFQDEQRIFDDLVGLLTGHISNEANAAGIELAFGIKETMRLGSIVVHLWAVALAHFETFLRNGPGQVAGR